MTTATMRAAVLDGVRSIRNRRVPIPAMGPAELLVRVLASGVCGSDLAAYRGTHPYKTAPVVLGHELCGVVEQVGAQVTGFAPGDLVCSAAFSPCDRCAACRGGAAHLCSDRANLSHRGWEGSLAEYVVLRENMTFRLAEHVDPVAGALVEPLTIGRHAVGLARPDPSVAVLGSGSIGLACVLAVRRSWRATVTCVDLGPAKGRLARAVGADRYVDAAEEDQAEVAERAGPAGVTFVASGHPGVLDQAAAMTRPGGQVVVVSYFPGPAAVDANALVGRELTVTGSALSTPEDFAEVIGWVERGLVDPRALVTHTVELAEAAEAFALADRADGTVGKVVIRTGTREG
ncbi:zinc-dependent alcohol dehydrogenase [Actinoalloteichus caeruleus]|uniref:zinc-dependent alcohol dehydrogenase n=1 Tax=Actinoalloteichus cyanogriseus TaxID=2893586 RepID=UPI0004A9E656|nr:alcohol dehydrogenase catalytic domain-containing protein [Actinoalloteichus caeruleus]